MCRKSGTYQELHRIVDPPRVEITQVLSNHRLHFILMSTVSVDGMGDLAAPQDKSGTCGFQRFQCVSVMKVVVGVGVLETLQKTAMIFSHFWTSPHAAVLCSLGANTND